MNKIQRLENIKTEVVAHFGSLTNNQLNWKLSKEKWSIAECLQHLIKSNATYFPALDSIIKGSTASFWEKFNPMSRSIGKSMVKSLGVTITRKHKSPVLFQPTRSSAAEDSVQAFSNHQDELIAKFRILDNEAAAGRNITSPVSHLITLPLSDCLEILAAHEERHLNQAKAVMRLESFPAG